MKAIRVSSFGDPDVLRLEEVPAPSPGPGQILVRLHAAGVNPVDAYIRAGKYAKLPNLPYTPGTDGAGVVEQSNDPAFAQGARVYIFAPLSGAYAEYALCAPEQVFPLPENATFQQGAALGVPYATAAWALFHRGMAKAGETLLIHGASGGVGLAALQFAHAAGLRVLGTAGTVDGLELIRKFGADAAFNHTESGYLDQIMAATGGRGVDIIIEMLANQNLNNDLGMLTPRGRVVVIGSRGPVEIDPRRIMQRDADIRGVSLWNVPPIDLASIHARIGEGLRSGALTPVIGESIPLAEAARAHERILSGGARGKIILGM